MFFYFFKGKTFTNLSSFHKRERKSYVVLMYPRKQRIESLMESDFEILIDLIDNANKYFLFR